MYQIFIRFLSLTLITYCWLANGFASYFTTKSMVLHQLSPNPWFLLYFLTCLFCFSCPWRCIFFLLMLLFQKHWCMDYHHFDLYSLLGCAQICLWNRVVSWGAVFNGQMICLFYCKSNKWAISLTTWTLYERQTWSSH